MVSESQGGTSRHSKVYTHRSASIHCRGWNSRRAAAASSAGGSANALPSCSGTEPLQHQRYRGRACSAPATRSPVTGAGNSAAQHGNAKKGLNSHGPRRVDPSSGAFQTCGMSGFEAHPFQRTLVRQRRQDGGGRYTHGEACKAIKSASHSHSG